MKRALIVAGGSIEDAFCLEYLQNNRFDHKTAVDLGLQFFYQNNLWHKIGRASCRERV